MEPTDALTATPQPLTAEELDRIIRDAGQEPGLASLLAAYETVEGYYMVAATVGSQPRPSISLSSSAATT